MQYVLGAPVLDIQQVVIYARNSAFFNETRNVTVRASDSLTVGSGITCAEGLTATYAGHRLKANCSAAAGMAVQYITVQVSEV